MPNLKAALDIENLKKELQEDLNSAPAYIKGIAGTDFAHTKYGWSLGIEGSFGGSDH